LVASLAAAHLLVISHPPPLSIVRDVVEVQLGCLDANEATTLTAFLTTLPPRLHGLSSTTTHSYCPVHQSRMAAESVSCSSGVSVLGGLTGAQVLPLRVQKGTNSTSSSPTKNLSFVQGRPLSELSPMALRRNSPSFPRVCWSNGCHDIRLTMA